MPRPCARTGHQRDLVLVEVRRPRLREGEAGEFDVGGPLDPDDG